MKDRRHFSRKVCDDEPDSEVQPASWTDELVTSMGNVIFFYASVSTASVLLLHRTLLEVSKSMMDQRDPIIYLFIHSPGGDLYAGLSAMDHIGSFHVPVYTVIDGLVASAATFIALAGKRRFIMPHACVLVHQLSTSFWGKYEDMVDEFKTSKRLMAVLTRTYLERTDLTEEKIKKILSRETHFGAKKAIKWGFVEELYKAKE